MTRYTGLIKLVILDIAGTVCDGPQSLSHLFPNDDGLAVKGPVIVFEKMFQKFGMNVDWETIRRPMGKFKREHLADIMAFEDEAGQYRKVHGRDYKESDLDEMFDMFRPTMAEVAVTEDLIRPFDGLKEAIDKLQTDGVLVGCDTGYQKKPVTPSLVPWKESTASGLTSLRIPKTSAAGRHPSWSTIACTRPTSIRRRP